MDRIVVALLIAATVALAGYAQPDRATQHVAVSSPAHG